MRIRLDTRAPFDPAVVLGFLARRATPGVEHVAGSTLTRVCRLSGRTGWIQCTLRSAPPGVDLLVSPELAPDLMEIVARTRRTLDLDASPQAVAAVLAEDPALAPLIAAAPGLRMVSTFDPFEAAVRALLGQQVTVRAATTLAGRLVERLGEPVPALGVPLPGPAFVFPAPERVAGASIDVLAGLGMPGARAAALRGLARAVADGEVALDPTADPESTIARLDELPGLGPWSAHVIAMRALGWPDAFPASDLALVKALGGTPRTAQERAARWRPFRAYAVMHLWHSQANG